MAGDHAADVQGDEPTQLPEGGQNAVALTLGIIGDEWTLLILRYATAGVRRYNARWFTRLRQVPLTGDGNVGTPVVALSGSSRLRTVKLGPDGRLWVTTDGRGTDSDGVERFPPVDAPPDFSITVPATATVVPARLHGAGQPQPLHRLHPARPTGR